MNKRYWLLTLIVLSQVAGSQGIGYDLRTRTQTPNNELLQNFLSPQDEVKMRVYWWWLNSYVTKASITRDLEEMKAKGIGGATLMDAGSSDYRVAHKTPAGPPFMSDAWMENYCHAIKEADRLGIEISINLQSGWNPGAPFVTPEFAAKRLTYSVCEVTGPAKIVQDLPVPSSQLMYEDILVQAFPKQPGDDGRVAIDNWEIKSMYRGMGAKGVYPLHQLWEDSPQKEGLPVVRLSEIIDLTAQVKNGKLEWDVPAGKWTVVRYGMTCTGARVSTSSEGWGGLSYDHLSKETFQLFADSVILPLIHSAFTAGKGLKYLHTDSWEMGTTNWTPLFISEFKDLRGYDMEPYMPVLAGKVVENKDVSNRFLRDVRRTIGDLVVKNHYQLMADLAKRNGLGIQPESGGPHSAPVDGLQTLGLSDIPTGEFWARSNTHRVTDAERLAVRQSASAAHTHGKRFAMAEGPTSIGPQWERSPRDLKNVLDRVFCSGTNRILWHTFTNSPQELGRPGIEYFAGTHLNPNATWWNYSGDFINYINRCSQMLSEGLYQADVLSYYGDDVPNFVFLKEDLATLPFGYGYDKCSKNVLLENAYMKDGRLYLPDGMNYKLLLLPETPRISPELLVKLENFVKEGLILVGNKPSGVTGLSGYPSCDSLVCAISERMWGNSSSPAVRNWGKGCIFTGTEISDVLKQLNIGPDFAFTSGSDRTHLDFIHRYTEQADFYFITNCLARSSIDDYVYRQLSDLPDRFETVTCRFRVSGKTPEIWDPKTGVIRQVADYREENGYTIFPLDIDPEGSLFIVFRETGAAEVKGALCMNGNEVKATANASPVLNKPVLYRQGDTWIGEVTEAGEYTLNTGKGETYSVKIKEGQKILPVQNSWKVKFEEKGGPTDPVEMKELRSWSEFEEESVRYYSGAAVYTTDLDLGKKDLTGNKVYLDLGNVLELVHVRVNGVDLGTSWYPPFVVDVTDCLKNGNNKLEITVVNMWPNRLIGDARLPQSERYTQTNIKKFELSEEAQKLRESGLKGPVRLICKPILIKKEQ